jgi:hypothetical protein
LPVLSPELVEGPKGCLVAAERGVTVRLCPTSPSPLRLIRSAHKASFRLVVSGLECSQHSKEHAGGMFDP